MRNENLLEKDIDPEEFAEEEREYIAMMIEINFVPVYPLATDSRETNIIDADLTGAKAVHVIRSGHHRNARRAAALSKPPGWLQKGKAPQNQVSDVPRRTLRKYAATATFKAPKGHQLPDGMGSLGTHALIAEVRIGSNEADPVKGRLDSGADITLMSEEFWAALPDRPTPKEGVRMKLYHLTGQAKVLGYIKTKLFMTTFDGTTVEFDLEAYVIKDMRVPLLLGEDFQTAYEIGVKRRSTGECSLSIGDSQLTVPASSSQFYDLGFEVKRAQIATTPALPPNAGSRVGASRRAIKALRKKEHQKLEAPVMAATDTLISPGSVHNLH